MLLESIVQESIRTMILSVMKERTEITISRLTSRIDNSHSRNISFQMTLQMSEKI